MPEKLAGHVEKFARHVRRHGCSPTVNSLESTDEVLERRILRHVATSTGLDPHKQVFLGLAGGEQNNIRARRNRADLLDHLEA